MAEIRLADHTGERLSVESTTLNSILPGPSGVARSKCARQAVCQIATQPKVFVHRKVFQVVLVCSFSTAIFEIASSYFEKYGWASQYSIKCLCLIRADSCE